VALLSLAQVGCGGMGLRHVYGLMELRTQGFDVFDLVALCDKQSSAVEHVASEAEKVLGKRPKTYTDFDEMLEKEPGVDAVDVVTDTRLHHVFYHQGSRGRQARGGAEAHGPHGEGLPEDDRDGKAGG
jgi:predicted dehydrogenase